jgi:CSLREA domain-containing protein
MALLAMLAPSLERPTAVYAASITVNTTDDELNGDCSLREAITAANTNAVMDACTPGVPGADTITFGVTGTITLSNSLPAIADALTIDGPSAASLTISGNNAVGVLTVNAGKTLNLRKVTIANGYGEVGSGILNNGGTLIVADSVIANNRGVDGGGIYNSSGGSVELINSTLSGNIADGYGGGIFNYGTFTITRSSLIGNRAVHTFITYGGGGIANAGTLRVISSTLSGNVADCFGCPGGGIYNLTGVVTLINSTLSGNTARSGGGVFNQSSSGFVTIVHSTFFNNRGPSGGANLLNFGGPIVLRNSIIANNLLSGNCFGNPFINSGRNLQFPNATCGSTIPVADPLLGPLQDNGGPTLTHALLSGSPAIDAVPVANCSEAPTDQRGVTRPQGPACDIGAFEVVVNQPPTAEAGGPYSVNEGGAVTVTASGSDPEGQPLTYTWDLNGDGTFETPGQSATFSAASLDGPGSHPIAVQVTDDGGLTATDQATINVFNVAPGATFNEPGTVNEGDVISLSLTDPADPSSADVAAGFTYAFDCGDGNGYGSFGPASSVSCPTDDNAIRAVGSKIRDQDSDETEYTATVTIDNVAPIANFTAAPGTLIAGQSATLVFSNPLDPSAADTAAGFLYSYDCTNDGAFELATSSLTSYACSYPIADAFTARGRIQDKDGGFIDYTVEITVLTPREGIEGLIEKVGDLVAQGVLNGGQGNALIAKLEAAIRQIDRGNVQTAINQLEAFVNQVNALMYADILPPAEGQPLIDAANEIIAALGG